LDEISEGVKIVKQIAIGINDVWLMKIKRKKKKQII